MACWWQFLFANWGAAESIALIAFVVAGWSAWSSHQSAKEAKRANEQFMYYERRAVFDAFLKISSHIEAEGQRPELGALRLFYPHRHTAAFCFDKEFVQKIETYWQASFEMTDFAAHKPITERPPKELHEKYKRDVQEISKSLLEEIKQAVR